jgi:hypothetical protein
MIAWECKHSVYFQFLKLNFDEVVCGCFHGDQAKIGKTTFEIDQNSKNSLCNHEFGTHSSLLCVVTLILNIDSLKFENNLANSVCASRGGLDMWLC